MNRSTFAIHLASGLAGWHQLQVVQNLGDLSGEDTARSLVAQIINAQGQFAPATSQLPPNWGPTKKRIDVALLGRTTGAAVWYGAIEIKWPGTAVDPHQVRQHIVQDAMRLAFVNTNGVNAKFLVVGGNSTAISKLFDNPHPNAADRESRRVAFNELLSRDLENPDGHLTHSLWSTQFPEAGERIPQTTFNVFNGRLKAELLARADATVGGNTVGTTLIWQCNRTRGTASKPGSQPDVAQ